MYLLYKMRCVYRQTIPSPFFLWSVQLLLYIPQFPPTCAPQKVEAKKKLKISRHTEAVFVVSQGAVPAG